MTVNQAQALTWEYDESVPASEVLAYGWAVTIDGAEYPGTPSCVVTGGKTTCTLPVTPPLEPGPHTVSVKALKDGSAAESILTVDPTGANLPHVPSTGPKLTITVTVTLG